MMNVVITGSSSGIGRMLSEHLVGHGHRVWGLARRAQPDSLLAATAERGEFRALVADVTDGESLVRIAGDIAMDCAGLNALICCAGTQGTAGPAMRGEPADWVRTVRTNLEGTFHTLVAFHSLLQQGASASADRSKVLCFSGGGATSPRPFFSAYGVAKAGIVRLVETVAAEWRAEGAAIDINAVAPGALHTAMTEEVLRLGPAVVGEAEHAAAQKTAADSAAGFARLRDLIDYLLSPETDGLAGKLFSAPWDPWPLTPAQKSAAMDSDVFTLRRITPEDRGW